MSRLDEIRELTRVRVLAFLREPEAIFWVFIFPIVLAAVLGFAFRSGGIEPSKVAVVGGTGDAAVEALLEVFELDEHLEAEVHEDREEAMRKLRNAAVDGLVEPGDPPRPGCASSGRWPWPSAAARTTPIWTWSRSPRRARATWTFSFRVSSG